MSSSSGPYYGKYRGVVTENEDSDQKQGKKLGRIKARVPDVLGDKETGWALPCVPYAGKDVGLFLMPPKNASVWIEFEQGDTDYPIWSGCFWAEGEIPVTPYTPDKKVIKTGAGTITLNDSSGDGGITIEMNKDPKLKIVLDKNGIEITSGKGASVKLKDNKVTVNDDALEVQ
jgi:uncharacterized protein involved in type VI secretion and phage assembly